MSQENVELSRALIDAFNHQDVEAMVRLAHPEIEWLPAVEAEVAGEPVVYRRPEGIREYFESVIVEYWEEYRAEVTEYRDLGDRILLLTSFHARGATSGVEIALPDAAAIHHWRDGKCIRAETYPTAEAALEAVGLSE